MQSAVPPKRNWGRYLFGLLLLLAVVVIWVAGSELMQYIFLDEEFESPFFLTYCSTSTFSVYLLIAGLKVLIKRLFNRYFGQTKTEGSEAVKAEKRLIEKKKKNRSGSNKSDSFEIIPLTQSQTGYSDDDDSEIEISLDMNNENGLDHPDNLNGKSNEFQMVETHQSLSKENTVEIDLGTQEMDGVKNQENGSSNHENASQNGIYDESTKENKNGFDMEGEDEDNEALSSETPPVALGERLTITETAKLSAQFCLLWFIANYSTNAALIYTSVTSSTILNSTSGFFTLLIGALFGVEILTFSKLLAVVVSLGGVVLVSISDGHGGGQESVLGDIISIFGAITYGCYIVFLKKKIGHEERVDMQLFFGFVGLFNFLFLWPGFFFLHAIGLESFEIPSKKVAIELVLNGLIGTCLSDYLWLLAMLMTSPVVVTLGLSLTIPLALGADIFQGKFEVTAGYWSGTVLVLLGFVLVNMTIYFQKMDRVVTSSISKCVRKLFCKKIA